MSLGVHLIDLVMVSGGDSAMAAVFGDHLEALMALVRPTLGAEVGGWRIIIDY